MNGQHGSAPAEMAALVPNLGARAADEGDLGRAASWGLGVWGLGSRAVGMKLPWRDGRVLLKDVARSSREGQPAPSGARCLSLNEGLAQYVMLLNRRLLCWKMSRKSTRIIHW